VRYLIAGRAGSGKSTICKELHSRGYNALDADKVKGLPRWEDPITKTPVIVDDFTHIDRTKVEWNWNAKKLEELLAENDDLILCGSADNDLTFFPLFDKVFILTIDPEQHVKRLRERSNNYGRHPDMHPIILEEQHNFAIAARALGATEISTTGTVDQVADMIVAEL
jgi:dephospho-CoA kinase